MKYSIYNEWFYDLWDKPFEKWFVTKTVTKHRNPLTVYLFDSVWDSQKRGYCSLDIAKQALKDYINNQNREDKLKALNENTKSFYYTDEDFLEK